MGSSMNCVVPLCSSFIFSVKECQEERSAQPNAKNHLSPIGYRKSTPCTSIILIGFPQTIDPINTWSNDQVFEIGNGAKLGSKHKWAKHSTEIHCRMLSPLHSFVWMKWEGQRCVIGVSFALKVWSIWQQCYKIRATERILYLLTIICGQVFLP